MSVGRGKLLAPYVNGRPRRAQTDGAISGKA